MTAAFSLDVRFYRLCEPLQPYFTALYHFDARTSPGHYEEDCLHPEWAAMRFSQGRVPLARIGPGPIEAQWPFVVSGPTSKAIRFGLTTTRVWGLGLLPAGWAKFVEGRANDFADRTVDGQADPAFHLFVPLMQIVSTQVAPDSAAQAINTYLMAQLGRRSPDEVQILACHDAVRDPDIASVTELGKRLGIGPRSLERLCNRYFGFPPKLLLRRQRFLRSLARFTLDARRSWCAALDEQYHDQAQFVRDFHAFMGMTPSHYAQLPHPVLDKIMAQRMADQGAAPQTDLPTVLRYAPAPHPARE